MAKDKRRMSAQAALEWAFGKECAQLELPDRRRVEDRGFGFGMEYVLMQRARLGGIQIDVSKGRSLPHDDAEIIAAILSALPDSAGGRHMAIKLAECARIMTAPDWMPGETAKITAREWRRGSRFKQYAKTEIIRRGAYTLVTAHPKNPARKISRRVEYTEEWCPCVWELHPQEIESARTEYQDWWRALDHIRGDLQASDMLRTIEVTDSMPPDRPWASRRGGTRRETIA